MPGKYPACDARLRSGGSALLRIQSFWGPGAASFLSSNEIDEVATSATARGAAATCYRVQKGWLRQGFYNEDEMRHVKLHVIAHVITQTVAVAPSFAQNECQTGGEPSPSAHTMFTCGKSVLSRFSKGSENLHLHTSSLVIFGHFSSTFSTPAPVNWLQL